MSSMPEALEINNGSLTDTTLCPNMRGKASMHSKCVGLTQVFGSKEKGARHLMKTVGRRKPESPAVVPSGTHGAGERKGSEGEKPQQGLWGCRERRTEGLQVYFCPPSPACTSSPAPSRWRSTTCLGTESQDSGLGKSRE